jgi:hypothetical protein
VDRNRVHAARRDTDSAAATNARVWHGKRGSTWLAERGGSAIRTRVVQGPSGDAGAAAYASN